MFLSFSYKVILIYSNHLRSLKIPYRSNGSMVLCSSTMFHQPHNNSSSTIHKTPTCNIHRTGFPGGNVITIKNLCLSENCVGGYFKRKECKEPGFKIPWPNLDTSTQKRTLMQSFPWHVHFPKREQNALIHK